MRITRNLEFQTGSKEEKLPYETTDFPYVASQAELDDYREPFVPWHWHNAIEMFYMESGQLKYHTPNETMVFFRRLGRYGEFKCTAYDGNPDSYGEKYIISPYF